MLVNLQNFNADLAGFLAFFSLLTLYLLVSALTEMGTRWPWNR